VTSCRRHTYEYTNSTFTTKLDISETKKFPYVIFENSLTSHQPMLKKKQRAYETRHENTSRVEPRNDVRHELNQETTCVRNTSRIIGTRKKPAVARELNANTQRQQSTMKSIVRRHPSSSLESSFASSRSRRDPCLHCITQQHDKHGEQTVLHPRNEGFTPST